MGMNPRYGNWGMAEWAGRAGTVADLIRQGWSVVANCTLCSLEMDVRLDVILKAKGPDFSLWGKQAKCRRRKCPGSMLFWTYPPEAKGGRVEMF